jgi:hypothetical protein
MGYILGDHAVGIGKGILRQIKVYPVLCLVSPVFRLVPFELGRIHNNKIP